MLSINQIAKFLGIPTQTIRMYERYGIFESARTKSNYRKFDRHVISTLVKSRMLQSMGLSMKEIAAITKGVTYEESLEILQTRERALAEELMVAEQKHRQAQQLIASLTEIRRKNGTCELVTVPEAYLYPVLFNGERAMTSKEMRTLDLAAQERLNEYAFIRQDAATIDLDTFLSDGPKPERNATKCFYLIVTAEDAQRFRLDVSHAVHAPACTCLKAYAISSAGAFTVLHQLFHFAANYLREHHLTPLSDPMISLPFFPQPGEQDNAFSMLIPVDAPSDGNS